MEATQAISTPVTQLETESQWITNGDAAELYELTALELSLVGGGMGNVSFV